MAFKIGLHDPAIEIFAELAADHVQNPAPLGIRMEAELVVGAVKVAAHDGVSVVGLVQDGVGITAHLVEESIAPVFMTGVKRVVVGGKTFVQPEMRPILARHEVAKPLMRQFVRHEAGAVAEVLRNVAEERAVIENRHRRVLHAAPAEVFDAHLIILRPRIEDADLLLEKIHHVLRSTKGTLCLGDLRRGRPEGHRDVAMRVFDLLEVTGTERDEVIHVRLVLEPAHGDKAGGGVLLLRHLAAVRDHDHAFRHAAGDFAGELLIRRVETRKPMTRLERLALGPEMRIARRIAHLSSAEVETLIRRGAVVNGHARLFVGGNRFRERHDDVLARRLIAEDLLA